LELSLHLLFVSSFGQELQDNETVSLGPSIALFITGAQRYVSSCQVKETMIRPYVFYLYCNGRMVSFP
jgi:hypothetical protein